MFQLDVFGLKMRPCLACLSALKLTIGVMPLISSYTQHSVLPQVPFGQILSVMCQRAGGESLLVHQGPCRADLKSQMRSHPGKKWRAKPINQNRHIPPHPLETKEIMDLGDTRGGRPQEKDLERKEATPPSCHASAHHTSHKLHTPFHLECSGPTIAEWYRTHSFMFAGFIITCSASVSAPENLPAEKTHLLGQTQK